ncbi:hypothetical protein [Synechocystis sp. LKSZ1]|uniref:hypothetical protein n=1 Tax=Synechocystis sp. LKSZ1 TaxID=3144951 RepID=UPI00336C19ED
MATIAEVKEYLAYWFQLGQGVIFPKSQEQLCPTPIFEGSHYSKEFEACWQKIVASHKDCYLQGTEQSIAELLTEQWELICCARCTLPIPTSRLYPPSCLCPCSDLLSWPNLDLPLPRLPINEVRHLRRVQERLTSQNLDADPQACPLPPAWEES